MVARRVAANTLWTLLGLVGPMLAAVWAIPLLVEGLGTERFGLMTIVWMVVGYFSLFDLGLGRALTKLVAERIGTHHEDEIAGVVKLGMRLLWVFGVLGGISICLLTPWLSGTFIKMDQSLRNEANISLLILATTVPFVIASTGSIGVLQGLHRFREVTWVRLPSGILNYVAPVLALPSGNSLVTVTLIVAGTRIVAALAYALLADRAVGVIRTDARSAPISVGARELLTFGGWVTVSSVIGPVMVYFDRFAIGGMLGAAAVAYYTTPFEVISRLSLIPGALQTVLFPTLVSRLGTQEDSGGRIYRSAYAVILLVMLPLVSAVVFFAEPALTAWLGRDFASQASISACWLAIGLYINSLAGLPFSAIQGCGRPDLTAKLHAFELALYIPGLWYSIATWGIAGAAFAWAVRNYLDLVILTRLVEHVVPKLRGTFASSNLSALLACAAIGSPLLLDSTYARLAVLLVIGAGCGFAGMIMIARSDLMPLRRRSVP